MNKVQSFVDLVNRKQAEAAIIVGMVATLEGVKLDSGQGATLGVLVAVGLVVCQFLGKRFKLLTAPTPATK